MDQNSQVQMTNFLYFSGSASVTLKVLDLDDVDGSGNPKVVLEWKLDKLTEKWEIFYGKVGRDIERAKVSILVMLEKKHFFKNIIDRYK